MHIKFRHIARAVVIHENKILVAKLKGAHSFLPGGGVELGEGAKAALGRELQEELAITSCQVGRFVGVIESSYEEVPHEVSVHEITHFFEVHVESLVSTEIPQSNESHLEFYWAELSEVSLTSHNVLPELLPTSLPSMVRNREPQWLSTFED